MSIEKQAIDFAINHQSAYLLAVFGCSFLGAAVGAVRSGDILPMHRVPYFINFALIYLAASAINYISLLAADAVVQGYFAWILLLTLLLPAICGFVYMRISVARSKDAYDNRRMALLAFIPLVNFVLFFRQSTSANSQTHLDDSRLLSGGVGVFIGLLILSAGLIANATFPSNYFDKPRSHLSLSEETKSLDQQDVESQLSAYLQRASAVINETLPRRIDEVTLLNRVEASGVTLTRVYSVERSEFNPNSQFVGLIQGYICDDKLLFEILSAGATIIERYTPKNGSHTDVSVEINDCESKPIESQP